MSPTGAVRIGIFFRDFCIAPAGLFGLGCVADRGLTAPAEVMSTLRACCAWLTSALLGPERFRPGGPAQPLPWPSGPGADDTIRGLGPEGRQSLCRGRQAPVGIQPITCRAPQGRHSQSATGLEGRHSHSRGRQVTVAIQPITCTAPQGRHSPTAYDRLDFAQHGAFRNKKGQTMSTHQQLLYHVVFSTSGRRRLLHDGMRDKVFAYMAGICRNLGGFALEANGFYDHAHLLVRIPAKVAVSDFVGSLKANTSKHVNEESGTLTRFRWQHGFGAFTVSRSMKDRVADYIRRQMEHHATQSFETEYLSLLAKHEVEYDERYVFD